MDVKTRAWLKKEVDRLSRQRAAKNMRGHKSLDRFVQNQMRKEVMCAPSGSETAGEEPYANPAPVLTHPSTASVWNAQVRSELTIAA